MYYKTSDQERINLGFGGHECSNGIHFCGFYETEKERDDLILDYLRQGLVDKARVLYTPTERSKDDFLKKFNEKFPDETHLINKNPLLTINNADDLYYQDGEFAPIRMNHNLNNFFVESQKNGKTNIRTTAEMVWAIDKHLDLTQLMAYESRLNYFIPGKPWVSICMYNLTRFDGQTIMKVLQTHPYTISKGGIITENPFYIHPDEWLAQNAPEYKN
jgi:hypothetical protein